MSCLDATPMASSSVAPHSFPAQRNTRATRSFHHRGRVNSCSQAVSRDRPMTLHRDDHRTFQTVLYSLLVVWRCRVSQSLVTVFRLTVNQPSNDPTVETAYDSLLCRHALVRAWATMVFKRLFTQRNITAYTATSIHIFARLTNM